MKNSKNLSSTLWAAYELVKNLDLNIGYAFTNEDNSDANTTNLQQLNATIAYMF
jgi:hypothetical protein